MIDWDKQPLGKVFDNVLAARLGVASDTVRRQRVKRGITALLHAIAIDWDEVPLGAAYDYVIAGDLGCTTPAVRYQRNKRGIAPFQKDGAT